MIRFARPLCVLLHFVAILQGYISQYLRRDLHETAEERYIRKGKKSPVIPIIPEDIPSSSTRNFSEREHVETMERHQLAPDRASTSWPIIPVNRPTIPKNLPMVSMSQPQNGYLLATKAALAALGLTAGAAAGYELHEGINNYLSSDTSSSTKNDQGYGSSTSYVTKYPMPVSYNTGTPAYNSYMTGTNAPVTYETGTAPPVSYMAALPAYGIPIALPP